MFLIMHVHFKEKKQSEWDSQVCKKCIVGKGGAGLYCDVLTALGISPRRVLHTQVVLCSTLPINLCFTNAIFLVWPPDNIPHVEGKKINFVWRRGKKSRYDV